MKKSSIMLRSAKKIANQDKVYICHTFTEKAWEFSRQIRSDIEEDIEALYRADNPSAPSSDVPNNFFGASPYDWEINHDMDFQVLRYMYCLFMREYYLSEGD